MIGKGDGLHDVEWVMSTLQEHRHDNAAVVYTYRKARRQPLSTNTMISYSILDELSSYIIPCIVGGCIRTNRAQVGGDG